MKAAQWILTEKNLTNLPSEDELDKKLPVVQPDLDYLNQRVSGDRMRVTWLGHATVLLQMQHLNILTDPVFSDRCSPIQMPPFGNKRFRRPPLTAEQLPDIDAVLISHDHYDHLDVNSVTAINKKSPNAHWLVGEGLGSWMKGCGVKHCTEFKWWQGECIEGHPDVKFVFTPAQHWSGRGALDANKTLWGSWCVLGTTQKFFFGGDTGYYEVFKVIGEKFGPFQLAAIPIGAYHPRWMMKMQHVDPAEAVLIHKDVQAERSLGVHWGTFALANEPWYEPKTLLEEELKKANIPLETFFTLNHGESRDM